MPRTASLLDSTRRRLQGKGETRTSPVFHCVFVPDILVVDLKLSVGLATRGFRESKVTLILTAAPLTDMWTEVLVDGGCSCGVKGKVQVRANVCCCFGKSTSTLYL